MTISTSAKTRSRTIKKRRVHIIKREDGWAIKKMGASRASRVYGSKEEAVRGGQALRRSGHDLVIHNSDGSIQKWESVFPA
jgi:hypothetical protein